MSDKKFIRALSEVHFHSMKDRYLLEEDEVQSIKRTRNRVKKAQQHKRRTWFNDPRYV